MTASLYDEFHAAASQLDGRLGVAVEPLSGGPIVEYQARSWYPTASTMKFPLLVALFAMAEKGRVNLSERVAIAEEHLRPGTGVLRTLEPGAQITLLDLATLMIIVSDNVATDLLFSVVGVEEVNASMRAYGLDGIHLSLTAKEILYSLVGLSEQEVTALGPKQAVAEFFRRRREGVIDSQSIPYREGIGNDVATPYDLMRLAAKVGRHEILTQSACQEILRIMKLQQLKNMIPRHIPIQVETATKSGSFECVRADVGIVFAGSNAFAIAGMANRLSEDLAGEHAVAQCALSSYQYFTNRGTR